MEGGKEDGRKTKKMMIVVYQGKNRRRWKENKEDKEYQAVIIYMSENGY